MNEKHKIALMHIYVNEQISPPSLDFERASSNVHSLCEIILFNSTAMEIHLCKNFQLFNFKTRPDGEVCSSHFNMQNGNSVRAGRCLWLAYFTYYHIVRLASFLR